MPNPIDIKNIKFGSLLALEPTDERSHNWIVWRCVCDCGREHLVAGALLKNGNTTSCGCLRREKARARMKTHGLSYTKLYKCQKESRRRSRKRSNGDSLTAVQTEDIIRFYEGKCVYCFEKYSHLDHVHPVSKGGDTSVENIVPACSRCNISKKDRIIWDTWFPPVTPLQAINL